MSNIYTTSTVDEAGFKELFCGRTNHIAELLDHLSRGRSVAIFGERRIGKSTLLFVLRDIINGEIDTYQVRLIDKQLQTAVGHFKTKAPKGQAIFVSLHDLTGSKPEDFVQLLCHELVKSGYRKPKDGASVIEVFEALNDQTANNERAVVLLDEVEVLLEFEESKQIFRHLRSVIQSNPRVCFVLAGAEDWHKQIKEKTSPLVGNVRTFYLKAAAQFSLETYLIAKPLADYLSPDSDIIEITRTVVEWSACKPMLVQAICYEMVAIRTTIRRLPHNWKTVVQKRVQESVGATLDAFYIGDNLDPLTQKILALLANEPTLTVEEMAQKLGDSAKAIGDKVSDLEALDKVRKQGSEYRIVGTLIEQWGKKTQDIPPIRSPWPQRLKWAGALLFLLLAVWTYFYTHPELQTFSFDFPNGAALVRIPASLEQEESGVAIIAVQNITQTTVYSVTVSLTSPDIDYQWDGTNRITFDSLNQGEIKFWEPTFISHPPISGSSYQSQILITEGTTGSTTTYPFDIPKRAWPIKKYWALVSLLLVALSGFVTKRDLGQLVSSVIPFLLKSSDKDNS